MAATTTNEPQDLLPILKHALPTIISYTIPSNGKVVQANAEGTPILARHSSSMSCTSEKFDNTQKEEGEEDRLLINVKEDNVDIEETELFLKRVTATSYTHKSWTDMRRTLVYLRTEVRFYNEIVPLLLAEENNTPSASPLHKHLPTVHHAEYNLDGLIPEDCPTTNAKQPSPFNEGDDDEAQQKKQQLLKEKGGHILLQSLSPSHGYFQDSPISKEQALQCLTAVAELHASAWGNTKLLQIINDRLSSAGGSYQLQFRNPKELENMVASWKYFCEKFTSLNDDKVTSILSKDGIAKLGQRIYDMAEYISNELTPQVGDDYATLVHGDFKAMNIFLPSESNKEGEAIMIDFSCVGIGFGMSDVGMHIVHAVLPEDLDNGGEEMLLEGYLTALEAAMNRKQVGSDEEKWAYQRDAALRHYQLACVDYIRFIMGRFWRSATPESFEKKKTSKNTTLINRNLEAALRFIQKVDIYLEVFEKEKKDKEAAAL